MFENKKDDNNSTSTSGMSKGLFGETDRSSGEYHFKSGRTQQVYSNAHYIPVDKSTTPPKYYRPAAQNSAAAKDRKKNGIGFFAVLALCLSCAVLGGLVSAAVMSSSFESRLSALEDSISATEELSLEMSSGETREETNSSSSSTATAASEAVSYDTVSASKIYDNACNEVVCINVETVYKDRDGYSIPSTVSGSGFVITSDGYILTNYHVVQKAAEDGFPVIVMFYNGDTYNGDVIGYDDKSDIALVKIDATDLQTVTLGDSSSVLVGDAVFAVGNPFQVLEFTMTTGHISALNRLIATEENENAIEMFQIDAAVYEGNSGGPLYNSRGEVIGIVSAKYSTSTNAEGIGFAIPINTAADIISNFLDESSFNSSKASLGAAFDDRYNSMYSQYYDMPVGAFVYYVEEDSCADKAGLASGDIITRIDSTTISDYEDLKEALHRYKAGDTAEIEFYRNGEMQIVSVTFDEAENNIDYSGSQSLTDAGFKRG